MKIVHAAACVAALLQSSAALAQPGPAVGAVVDCGKARDPQRCEAHQAAVAACRNERGAQRRQCIDKQMPPRDCSQSRLPARCEAMNQAQAACRDKVGRDHRLCLRDQLKVAASTPATPATNAAKAPATAP